MADIALTPAEKADLSRILAEDFEAARLRAMAEAWFALKLDLIAPGAAPVEAAEKFVAWAEQNGRTLELLARLRRDAPKSLRLLAFLATMANPGASSPLQAFTQLNLSMAQWMPFATLMLLRGRQICRVEVGGVALGTGVLVGEDRVLTAFHVVRGCIDTAAVPLVALPGQGKRIICRFDYLEDQNKNLGDGTPVRAADNWLLAASMHHPREGELLDLPAPPDCSQHLDYALIRLERAVGKEPVEPGGGGPRDWVPFPEGEVYPNQALVIGQCPGGQPLHIDVGRVESLDQRKSRVRYRLDTILGSSGSPCFDLEFNLVALHNASLRDPSLTAPLNQGVSIRQIRDHLQAANSLQSAPPPDFVPLWQLPRGAPVFGREDFQHSAWSMRLPASKQRFLAIKGGDDQSRRFTIELAKSIFAGRADVVIDYDLAAIQLKSADAFLLDLATDLKLPTEDVPARPVDRQSSRWASTTLFDWFKTAFNTKFVTTPEAPLSVWIALDNYDRAAFLDPETADVLLSLMRAPEELPSLRWLLIGAAPDPAAVPSQLVTEDVIQPPTPEDVGRYLQHHAEHHNKRPTPATLQQTATTVFNTAQSFSASMKQPFLVILATLAGEFANNLP